MNKGFQFKIQIRGIKKPPVWRRVIVPETYTFEHFHYIIQSAFGWTNTHLFQFCPAGIGSFPVITRPDTESDFPTENAGLVILKDIFNDVDQTYTYVYDFGDNWHHTITLEAILSDSPEEASCIAGKGACPPEDCGGIWGYEDLKKILSDPHNPKHKKMKKWIGLEFDETWNADFFDIEWAQEIIKEESIIFSSKTPEFNHPEVEIFYRNDYDIDRDVLHEIMALPRQTLIEDMQKMLIDCVERFEYFSEYEDSETYFPMHAMYVLSSLRAEEALDTLLFVLSQNEDLLDFWFGELIIDEFWQHLYWMGQNQTEKLKTFFFDPKNDQFVRSVVVATITQIAIRQPDRKQEMIKWETDAIEYLLENIKEVIFESFILECLVCDLINIGDMSIFPLIKRCLDTGKVPKKETGTLSQIKEQLESDEIDSYYDIFKLYTDIDQFYDEWERWSVELYGEENISDYYRSITPFIAPPKAGRNDPCPCSSGKKYKKCCGMNE